MTDWFRSWHGAPTDPKWLGIAKRAGVAPGIAVAIGWALMDRASQASDRGSIAGYDADGLACFFGCEPENVEAIVTAMTDKGMIAADRFTNWERRQPKREDDSAQRVREHRKRKAEAEQHFVTQCNAPETDTESEQKETPTGVSKKRGERLPADFDPDIGIAVAIGLTEVQARNEAVKFREWWPAQPGQRGVKLDWNLTWRTWCRKALERIPQARATSPPKQTVGQQARDDLKRMGMMNAPDDETRHHDKGDGEPGFAGSGIARRIAIAASR